MEITNKIWNALFNKIEEAAVIINDNFSIEAINDKGKELLGDFDLQDKPKKCYEHICQHNEPMQNCPLIKHKKNNDPEKDYILERNGSFFKVNTSKIVLENDEVKYVDILHDITNEVIATNKQKELIKKYEALNEEYLTSSEELKESLNQTRLLNTQLKESLEQLKAKEDTLATIFNSAPSIMMLLDKNLEIIELNSSGLKMANLTKSQKASGLRNGDIFRCINTLNNPEGCGSGDSCNTCKIRQTIKNTAERDINQYRIEAGINVIAENNKIKALKLLVSSTKIITNGSKQILVTIEDITKIRNQEAIIRQSEEKFKKAFFTSPDAVTINLMDGTYIDINYGFTQLTEFTEADVIGKTSNEINIWTNYHDREKLLRTLESKGSIENLEAVFRCKSGKLKTALMSASLIEIDDEPAILSVTRDITELRLGRTLLDRAQKIGLIGTWVLDLINGDLQWTKQNYEIYGIPNNSTINFDTFANAIHPGDKDYVLSEWSAAIEGKPYDIEHRIIANAKIKWVRQKADIEYHEGLVIKAVGVTQDISNQKQLQLNLQEKNEQYISINNELNKAYKDLFDTKKQLQVKLDKILSPDASIKDFELADFINTEQLQKIQDSFAKATGIASIITRSNGEAITKPSNFSHLCSLIRQTEKGKLNCINSDKKIGELALHTASPVIKPCFSCGLYDAASCITVGGKVVAYWLIGQVKTPDVSEVSIAQYAKKIGADKESLVNAFREMESISLVRFKNITNHLQVITSEISLLTYNNVNSSLKF